MENCKKLDLVRGSLIGGAAGDALGYAVDICHYERRNKEMKKDVLIFICLIFPILLSAQEVESFVRKQLEAYPQTRLLDIYKSCFQDYMGAEHLVSDHQKVKSFLDEELKAADADALMPWYYEFCGIDGRFVRISLRTIKENLLDEDLLLDAFVHSAGRAGRPSVESWKNRWHVIVGVIDRMNIDLPDYGKDKAFLDSILSIGKYAISHSKEYREAYRPHYRIVERDIFDREIRPLLESKLMIVRIAEIEVFPGYLKDYLKAARTVGAESVRKEPGVVCIFPNQLKENENMFRIVEIYRNKEAYEQHLTTEHFQAYKQGTLHMVKSLQLVDVKPLDENTMPLLFNKLK